MKCPHCLENFHDNFADISAAEDVDGTWEISSEMCPACKRLIYRLHQKKWTGHGWRDLFTVFFRPMGMQRPQPNVAVTSPQRDDYIEAASVLHLSAKASAALSRRCLQSVLREKAGCKHHNLADQIQAVLDSNKLPSHINESLDAVRNIGNFAAHPMKSTASGEIIEVEPGEAEWNLDVLDSLFDYYFIQPELTARKKAALNAKLASANKPPMKG